MAPRAGDPNKHRMAGLFEAGDIGQMPA